jgi:hypothetical protein
VEVNGEPSMVDVITMCKERATEELEYFLNTLSFVPADKLTWSPTPTAKSALQIAAHCAGYSGGFASVIRQPRRSPDHFTKKKSR